MCSEPYRLWCRSWNRIILDEEGICVEQYGGRAVLIFPMVEDGGLGDIIEEH